jgi:membrane fusion protein, multidrug efflux system
VDVSVKNASAPRARVLPDRRRRWLFALGAAIALLGLIWLAWWLRYSRLYESTDDAYVAGDRVNVMSQVSGTVVSIGADETDLVEGGQELVRLDATDARIALQDAEQQLARSVRQTHTVFANRDQLRAVVAERRADLGRAQSDFDRRRNLAASGAVSGEELGHAQDALQAARDALLAAQKNLAAGSALVGHTGVADNPDVRAAATQVERAWLALVRTSVRAPVTGYLARRSVQLGERISPGAPLMAIVPIGRLWLEANFREVQLRHMRIGQPATVVADLYGGRVTYHGHVAGLGLGTGSAFALLPAQNATGNWIKVVQRVPVRIELEPRELSAHPLRIGLSTVVTVEVRETSGPQLAQTARQQPVLSTRVFDIDRSEIRTRIEQIIEENTEHTAQGVTPQGVTPSARRQSADQSGFR